MSYEQRSYAGNATDTTLAADMSAGVLTFSVKAGDGANFPDGSGGPFYVIIDYDTSAAEKVRVTGRTSDTFTVPVSNGRGVDGTPATTHTSGAKVRHCWTATDAQEANRAALNTVGRVTTKGDLLAGTAGNALDRVAVGSNGQVMTADSTQTTGIKWAVAPAYGPAWVGSMQPSQGSVSHQPSTDTCRYFKVRVPETVTISGLRLCITTSQGNLDVGVYADSAGSPAAKIVSSGSTASPGTGLRTIAFTPTTLTAGVTYWLALSVTGTPPIVAATQVVDASVLADVVKTTAGFPLPSTGSGATSTALNFVHLIGYLV